MDCIVCTIDGDDTFIARNDQFDFQMLQGSFWIPAEDTLTLVDEKMSVEKTQIYFCRNWCGSRETDL